MYNLRTLTEAKAELAKLQVGQVKTQDKDITMQGWKIKAQGQNYSPVSINNTGQQMGMIYQFLLKETKLKDITEDVYYKFAADWRSWLFRRNFT